MDYFDFVGRYLDADDIRSLARQYGILGRTKTELLPQIVEHPLFDFDDLEDFLRDADLRFICEDLDLPVSGTKYEKWERIREIILPYKSEQGEISINEDEQEVHSSSQLIFCCYAAEDRSKVREIYDRLKQDGFAPWMAPNDLLGGAHWESTIMDVIRNSVLVLAFISYDSVGKTGFVQRELRETLKILSMKPQEEIFLVPLRLDEVKVPNLSVGPINLRDYHWIDYFKPGGYEELIQAIRQKIQPNLEE